MSNENEMSNDDIALKKQKRVFRIIAAAIVIVIIVSIGLLTDPTKANNVNNTPDQASKALQLIPKPSFDTGIENTAILLKTPVNEKVCLGIFPTQQIAEAYYIPKEEAQRELIRRIEVLDKVAIPEGIYKERYSLGIHLAYQGLEWQILNDGSLYHYGFNEQSQEYTEYFAEDNVLCEMVLEIAERELAIVPFDQSMIKDVVKAELTVAFSNKKEKVYNQVITEEAALDTMEKLFSEAEVIRGGSGCPFTEGIMTLTLADGSRIKLAMATDSCCVYFVNGIYFTYKPAEIRDTVDSGVNNNIIFDYFDEVPIATRGKSLN